MVVCLGLPGWASTQRDIHRLIWGCPWGDTCHLLGFLVQGIRGRCTDNLDYWCIRLHHPHHFTSDALPAATLPIYPALGRAPSMLGCIFSGLVALEKITKTKILNYLTAHTVQIMTDRHPFTGIFSKTTSVFWKYKGKSCWILRKHKMKGGSNISWTKYAFERPSLVCNNPSKLVGTYVRLPLGVVGSPAGKWLHVVRGRRSPPSWHPLVAGGSASEQARLVKTVKVQ